MARLKIAVTGGIGSGKSSVMQILNELGFVTLSSDSIVWELYKTRKVKMAIAVLFPTAIKGKARLSVDRAELTRVAFSSPENHKKLTDLVTPLVMAEIDRRVKRIKGVVFVEVPLLFECNYQSLFDGAWVVTRPLEDRINSVMARSKLTREQVLERVAKQVDYDKLNFSAYTVVDNSGDKANLKNKILFLTKGL